MKFLTLMFFCLASIISAATFHREEEFVKNVPKYGCRTTTEPCEDANLVKRIISAYQLAEKNNLGDSMWQMFYDQKFYKIHDIFQSGNFTEATNILRTPGQSELFYGLENLCSSLLPQKFTQDLLDQAATDCLDCLVRFGEAIGAIKLENQEQHSKDFYRHWYANDILDKIETKLGISINFPNPYPDEIGIYTDHGIASYRAIQSLYQAYLIKELLKGIPHPRVLEIGAGLGRTAYYCKQFGIEDYTIIDIPTTILASSYFLGRTLGEDQVVLLGESLDNSENKIKILTPDNFLNDSSNYDLIINIDSITEFDPLTIKKYLNKIQQISPMFLSINHEWNKYSVYEILSVSQNVKKLQRHPYWIRLGYVEELYIFNERGETQFQLQ
jgi:hypothetical protein